MSSLIPERPLVISPSLATTIGLEEAVLLQLLNDASAFAQANNQKGFEWFTLSTNELNQALPFWDTNALQQVSNSLKDKGIILIDSPPIIQCHYLRFAMNEASQIPTDKPIAQPAAQRLPAALSQPTAPSTPSNRGAKTLPVHWQPEEELLQLLALNHNIQRDFALQQCEDFVLYWRDRQEVSHSWSSKFRQHVLKEWRFKQSRQASTDRIQQPAQDIYGEWQPSVDALEILHRTGISPEFIEDAIPEFVLYWRERGQAHGTWNSKFIAHIRRQWAKFTAAMEADYEPRAISANWQPNEDVYDILRLANIDIDFARQLVSEFVLFWRDTKEIHRSWNTKFLQHTKYQWATRHKMEQAHARQSNDHQPGQAKDGSLIKRLTDRSWAKGIVEGI